jgi:membrane protein implicated in regulation of membrane protease activity
MDGITEFLNSQPAWHWWTFGAVLIALEIATMSSYLLWPGIAALVVGIIKLLIPSLDGRLATFLFAVFAVVATVIWKRTPWGGAPTGPRSTLNARSAQYVGRFGKAADDFKGGRGAILIDDSRWIAVVYDGSAPAKGDMLEVTGADGATLSVRIAPGSLLLNPAT